MAGFLKKAINFVKEKALPSAAMFMTGNIGGAVTNLLTKKDKSATVSMGQNIKTNPELILATPTATGSYEKYDYTKTMAENGEGKKDLMKWALIGGGGLLAVFAFLNLSKKR